MTVRGVLFDVGGPIDTEVAYERLIDSHIREALGDEGITVTDEAFAAADAWAVASFAPNAYAAIVWRLAGGDRAAAERAFASVTARGPERQAARGGIELREGIAPLIERLHGMGLVLGLAANQPATAIAELDRVGIGKFFAHREVTGVHGLRKPDTRLFLRACDDLGFDPSDCLMVGDRIDNDIAPARLLGMRTVLFRTGRHAAQQPRSWDELPDAEVDDAAGLEAAIGRIVAE
jgi:HAD superfamily hydrolase (TIGR01549 family)